VQVAVLQLQQPGVGWSGVVVARGDSKGKLPFTVGVRIKGRGDEQRQHAASVVAMAVELLAWARRDAVPYFDRTSADLAAGSIGAMYASLESDQRDRFVSLLWPDVSVDALLGDPALPTDPLLPHTRSARSRAEVVARWVWDTVYAAVEYFDHEGAR
jgi:hypothetical protein